MTYFRRPSKPKGGAGDSTHRRHESPQSHGADGGKRAILSTLNPKDLHTVGPYVDQAQDIIGEIHQLLNAAPLSMDSLAIEPLDVVDLKRPVGKMEHDTSLAHESLAAAGVSAKHGNTPEHPLASEASAHAVSSGQGTGQRPPFHDLHADVVAQTSQAMNEFTQAVHASAKSGQNRRDETPQSWNPQSTPGGLSLEAMIHQAVNTAVSQWMTHNAKTLEEASENIMRQHVPSLVAQWLNKHLPNQLRQAIDHHLHTITQRAHHPHGHLSS